ncbi:lipocalin-like domain-containing protein [Microbacterium sp.]|uniref:lipocalin-like domain-containing protein n=1 Tax=Microbacterium sp. TaxID=51671 RepID=UPI002E3163C1|nr:lipocalin-like domain-containing protein [Microbacterium sp.]HEX5729608.1 lipocalin-like domain-containing protein [Microbacterium sp.]
MTHFSWKARTVGVGVAVALTAALTACGPGGVAAPEVPVPDNPIWTGTTQPDPVPEENVVLSMPEDMYRHDGAPTEWWWHIGTLRAGDRVFGFEVNAASFTGQDFAMTQVSLSDVEAGRHYERTQVYGPAPVGVFDIATWAEGDPSKDWYARLGDPDWQVGGFSVTNGGSGYTKAPDVTIEGDGSDASGIAVLDADGAVAEIVLLKPGSDYTTTPTVTLTGGGGSGATAVAVRNAVSMTAPQADPTKDIEVTALLVDDETLEQVDFDLTFSQQGRPFYVWGTGIDPNSTEETFAKDNYYFSFTRLAASGTITVAGQEYEVEGTTWMDHEYGYFGGSSSDARVRWLLQDMQLDNGYTISNAGIIGEGFKPEIGVAVDAYATVQDAEGNLYYVASKITPVGELWTSPATGNSYAEQFRVEIPSFQSDITVSVRLQDQEFAISGSPVYEGTAEPEGTFLGEPITGDAWIEQAF